MKMNDAFPGQFLKAADIDKVLDLTIKDVKMQTVGEDSRLVAYFHEEDRGLVLNKTNFSAIEEFTGHPDTDDWTDYKIRLVVVKVEYQGKRVPGIRVSAAKYVGSGAAADTADNTPSDDDIPF